MKDDESKKLKNGKIQLSVNPDTTPILYTDNINMTSNEDGVIFNVTQRIGPTNQARIVARIGMSRVHAKKFVERLGQLLLKSEGAMVTGKKLVN